MCPPRLLSVPATAYYLGLSTWQVRRLAQAGVLRRVAIPAGHGQEIRRHLFDVHDLDELIAQAKV